MATGKNFHCTIFLLVIRGGGLFLLFTGLIPSTQQTVGAAQVPAQEIMDGWMDGWMNFSLPSPAPDLGGEHCSGTPVDTGSWQMGVELVALPRTIQSSSLQGPWLSPCQTWGRGGQRDRRPCSFKLLPSLPGPQVG